MKSKMLILAFALVLVAAACNKTSNTDTNTETDGVSQTPSPTPSVTPNPEPTPALTPSESPTPTPGSNPDPTPAPDPTPSPVIITISSGGFSPSTVTVKAGTKVVFQNNDSKGHWVASNPHPTHTDLPGFDALKTIAGGSSYTYTFTKVGTWGYHDHLSPSLGGKVIVTN